MIVNLDRVDVNVVLLIPVLGRPQAVAPLLESLNVSTHIPHRVLFLCSSDDSKEIAAVRKAGCDYLTFEGPPAHGQYAKKINLGYRETREEWLVLAADDITFEPGWLEAALHAAGERFDVVSFDDCANYFVRQGLLATHSLMRRSYIDERGGSLDGPGIIYHEGYSHNFVDAEMSVLARQRGVFVYAKGAVVPHHHPAFGAPTDATYTYGSGNFHPDRTLFCERMAAYVRDPLARRFIRAERTYQMREARVRRRRR